jgi:hypothetical protein
MAETINRREIYFDFQRIVPWHLWRLSKEQPPSKSLQTSDAEKESSGNACTWLGVNYTYICELLEFGRSNPSLKTLWASST